MLTSENKNRIYKKRSYLESTLRLACKVKIIQIKTYKLWANCLQGDVWWHYCCTSSSIQLFSAVFHDILISLIPFQQMSDECYDKTFIANVIDSSHLPWKRPGPLIGQVGSMSHLCVFRLSQMSSTMWSHHLRKLCALITEAERSEVTVQPAVILITRGLKRCCDETDKFIRTTVTRRVSVKFRWLDCNKLNPVSKSINLPVRS